MSENSTQSVTAHAAAEPSAGKVYTPRDPVPLARTLVIWLWIDLAVYTAYTLVQIAIAAFLDRVEVDAEATELAMVPGSELLVTWESVLLLLALASFLITGFLSLKWIYRVSRNAHSLATGLKISPPWAVGWFFVPIAWLWKPFQGVREAWQVSIDPDAWRSVPVPGLLRWWWGLWLLSGALESLVTRLSFSATSVGDLLAVTAVDIASGLVAAPTSLVFIAIVRRLTAHQAEALRGSVFA